MKTLVLTVSPTFAPHLAEWGPSHEPCPSREAAEAYCRELATGHYENFPVASIVVPKRLRQPMCNVYAFCRWADDLGDEVESTDESLRLLAWWREQLRLCFDGTATHPVFIALRKTVSDFALAIEPFDDLIDAFEQDQRVMSYDSRDELRDYCRRSANPVGRIVLRLFGQDTPDRIAMSDRVCTGLQLVNFWQDVGRDADIGRTYLPSDVRRRYRYTDDMLAGRITNEAFTDVMKFLVDEAREELLAGRELARTLRGRLRIAISLFYRGGLAICDKIEAIDYHVWDQRPTVSKRDALRMLLASLGRA